MLHGTIQLFGTVLCLAGYLVVLAVNSSIGQSNIGTHVSSARVAAHIYLGYLTLFGMVVQVRVQCECCCFVCGHIVLYMFTC